MKKGIIKIGIFFSLIALATIGTTVVNNNNTAFNLAFANMEALASSGEGGTAGAHTLECGKGGIKLCKGKCSRCQIELEAWGNGSPVTIYCPLN